MTMSSLNILDARFLTLKEVCNLTRMGKSTIYAEMRAGNFPPPIAVSSRKNVWLTSDLERWLKAKTRERDATWQRDTARSAGRSQTGR